MSGDTGRVTHRHSMHRGDLPFDQLGPGITIELTNTSGGTVVPGDVVVFDPANDDAFTTTSTSALASRGIGVVVGREAVPNGSNGHVFMAGLLNGSNYNLNGSNLRVNGSSLTRGHYLYTGLAKSAWAQATRTSGAFGQVVRAGTNPVVYLWGVCDP